MSNKFFKFIIVLFLGGLFLVEQAFAGEMVQEENNIRDYYIVQEGDSLSKVSAEYNIPLFQLIQANKLESTVIYPGDVLVIPGEKGNKEIPEVLSRSRISREELMLLARVIHAEARGESFAGKVAVGAVILNRVASPYFPDTIQEVIMQKDQFTPVADGSINLEPDETAIRAAVQALMGRDPTNGALFFYNPRTASDRWIRTLPVITLIGNHAFATKA